MLESPENKPPENKKEYSEAEQRMSFLWLKYRDLQSRVAGDEYNPPSPMLQEHAADRFGIRSDRNIALLKETLGKMIEVLDEMSKLDLPPEAVHTLNAPDLRERGELFEFKAKF